MANELTLSINAELVNGLLREEFRPGGGSFSATQTLARVFGGVFGLTTSEEVLAATDVTTLGYMFIQNMSESNNVEYGPESGGAMIPFGLLKPGEAAVVRLKPGITIRAKAASGTPDLFYKILAD